MWMFIEDVTMDDSSNQMNYEVYVYTLLSELQIDNDQKNTAKGTQDFVKAGKLNILLRPSAKEFHESIKIDGCIYNFVT